MRDRRRLRAAPRSGASAGRAWVWRAAVAVLAAELAVEVVRSIVVEHSLGVDTIALVAMVGALALGQELAGAVVGLMFSGGAALETLAARQARRELTSLVQRAPKRHAAPATTVASARSRSTRVQVGDVVVVRTGEVVPVDGTVVSAEAVVDTSTLSGEPLPETRSRGMAVLSGSANAGAPFELRADRPGGRERVRRARRGSSRRPHRAGRRSCAWPTDTPGSSCRRRCSSPASRGPSAATRSARSPSSSWRRRVRSSSPPRSRSSPVCPGRRAPASSSRAQASIESLGRARTVLFDKTGTLTVGTPEVRQVLAAGRRRRRASCCGSPRRSIGSPPTCSRPRSSRRPRRPASSCRCPRTSVKSPGQGIAGSVEGHAVLVGSRTLLREHEHRAGRDRLDVADGHPRLGRGARARRRSMATSPD